MTDSYNSIKSMAQQQGATFRMILVEFAKKALALIAEYRNNVIMAIRDNILNRMSELDISTYRLSKLLAPGIPQRTIYDYLAGKTDGSDKLISAIMEALDLNVVVKRKRKEGVQ